MHFDGLARLTGEGELIAYFGYGSLVNPNTHRTKVIHYERASLKGFSRTWQARPDQADQPIALLSAVASASEDVLEGLLVFDHINNLPSLDERESGYDRLAVSADRISLVDGLDVPDCPLYVYSGRPPHNPNLRHYILQSYLDAVLQGYLHQYGEVGARSFMARTDAFDTPLVMDRHKPNYPRPVDLSAGETRLIDELTEFMSKVDQW